jgi:hypothetical protein
MEILLFIFCFLLIIYGGYKKFKKVDEKKINESDFEIIQKEIYKEKDE